jgi:hypothetical protein
MLSKLTVVLLILFVSLSGCAKNRSLAPPADSEQMTITVKVPDELKPRTLEAMYRSAVCKRITHGASGQRIELEGYHGIKVRLEQQGQSDLFQAKLPMDGGGACQWHLSNVTFGVTYGNPTRFGGDVTSGAGGGVVVRFDDNRPSRSEGSIQDIDGDLIIKKDYYPWVKENAIGEYSKRISLLGYGEYYYLNYKAVSARSVHFEPVFHADFVVSSTGPRVKVKGGLEKFIYPDGSVEEVARAKPDFRKLEAIRQAAESK